MGLEDKVQANTDTMKELLGYMKGNRSNGGNNTNTSTNTGIPGIDMVANGVTGLKNIVYDTSGALIDFTGKLVRGNAQIPEVASVFKTMASQLGGFGALFGTGVEGIANYMNESVVNWQSFSDQGVTMGGNASRLNLAMANTGLNADDFAETVKSLGPQALNLGRTVSEGVTYFSEFSSEFQKGDAGRRLRELGYNTKTTNDLLVMYTRNRTDLDLRDAASRAKAIEAVEKLGTAMTETTAITGVSRTKQIDAIKDMQDDASYRAAVARAVIDGDKTFLAMSRSLQENFKEFKDNPTLMKGIKDSMASGGIIDPQVLQSLMKIMPGVTQEIQEMGYTLKYGTDEERQRIVKEFENGALREKIAKEYTEGPALNFAQTQGIYTETEKKDFFGPFSVVMNRLLAGTSLATAGKDDLAERKTASGQENEGKLLRDEGPLKAGDIDPGRETTKLVLNTNARLKDLTRYSNEFIYKLNNELGMAADGIRAYNVQPILNNGNTFLKLFSDRFDRTKWEAMKPEDAKGYMMNMLEGIMGELGSKKGDGAQAKAGGGSFDSGYAIVGELGPELAKMNGPGDMLTALDTKNMASDMKNGMNNVMPLLSMLREIPQVISNAVDSTDNNTASSTTQVGQEESTELLKQISNDMKQFVSVASQIASAAEKTARNTDDIGDSVY